MSTIKVLIRLIDGGLHEYDESPQFLEELRWLQSQGYTGKRLVDELITDDWGVPPRAVEIWGKDSDGNNFNVDISYA